MQHALRLVVLLLGSAVATTAQGPPPGYGPPAGVVAASTGSPSTNETSAVRGGYSGPPRPGNSGPALVAVAVICTLISTLFVFARIWRSWSIKKFRWDDGLILTSIVFLVATSAVNIAGVAYGQGRHIETIQPEGKLEQALRLCIVGNFVGAIAFSLAKASVAMTLIQIGLSPAFNIIIVIVLVISVFSNLYNAIIIFVACQTRFLFYTGVDLPCASILVYYGSATWLKAAANLLLDVVYFLAPIWFLRKVKMHARDRMAVHVLLSFLLLASFFTIASAAIAQTTVYGGNDLTWTTVPVLCLQTGEIAASIMAACLPAIRQLYGQRFPKKWQFWNTGFSSSRGSSKPSATTSESGGSKRSWPKGVKKTTTFATTTDLDAKYSTQSRDVTSSSLGKEVYIDSAPTSPRQQPPPHRSLWPSKHHIVDQYEVMSASRDGRSSQDDVEKGPPPQRADVYELEHSQHTSPQHAHQPQHHELGGRSLSRGSMESMMQTDWRGRSVYV